MSIQDIAGRHLQHVKPGGDEHLQARCPFHATKSGTPFSMNTRTGMWICFSCGASGSFAKFLYRLGYSREQVDAYVKTARLDDTVSEMLRTLGMGRQKWSTLPEYILGAYEGCPTSLLDAGFEMETLYEADIGYDRVEDRITFPIRDYLGRLVAVSGRARENWKEPRYKVYDDPFKALYADGVYEPKVKLHLYGLHSIYAERYYARDRSALPPVVLVEGYKGCLWMRQLGHAHTVAMMGSMMSRMQAWLISRLPGPYHVMLDHEQGKNFPDEQRRCAAYEIAKRLSRAGEAKVCSYPDGSKEGTSPDDLTREQADQVVGAARSLADLAVSAIPVTPWKRRITKHVLQQVP